MTAARGPASPTIGVTFLDYLLPLGRSSSDEEPKDDDVDDPNWDAEYADFYGDSDEGNSDWELEESDVIDEVGPSDDLLVDAGAFDSRYADGHWNCIEITLVGDHETFLGPTLGPTCRTTRRGIPFHDFFTIFWLDCDLETICRETNKYAAQESIQHLGMLNGRGSWQTLAVAELKCWLGFCLLMGLKQQPTIRSY